MQISRRTDTQIEKLCGATSQVERRAQTPYLGDGGGDLGELGHLFHDALRAEWVAGVPVHRIPGGHKAGQTTHPTDTDRRRTNRQTPTSQPTYKQREGASRTTKEPLPAHRHAHKLPLARRTQGLPLQYLPEHTCFTCTSTNKRQTEIKTR